MGLIPGLTPWVKDPVLPWLCCRPVAAALVPPPSLGTCICCRCSTKKKIKKTRRYTKKTTSTFSHQDIAKENSINTMGYHFTFARMED